MVFKQRKLVKPEDLNPRGTLFGGRLMCWIDEEAAIFAMCQLQEKTIVTKLISEVNFMAPACQGDIVEIGMEVVSIGKTSITLRCEVRNKDTGKTIVSIDKMVFVSVHENGLPKVHGMGITNLDEFCKKIKHFFTNEMDFEFKDSNKKTLTKSVIYSLNVIDDTRAWVFIQNRINTELFIVSLCANDGHIYVFKHAHKIFDKELLLNDLVLLTKEYLHNVLIDNGVL